MSRIINPTYPSIIHNIDESERRACEANTSSLGIRLWDVVQRTYDLGFTAFGGPPVHFQILHRRFVDGMGKIPWISEQTVGPYIFAGPSDMILIANLFYSIKSSSPLLKPFQGRHQQK